MAEKWNGKTQVGRWTVSDQSITKANGERAWLCRCSCGTERYVLERSLRYGGSVSCGCLANERAKAAVSHKLDGMVFGDLTVLHIASTQKNSGGVRWTCRCTCEKEIDVPAKENLITTEKVQNLVYTIRGQQVMLDSDLAKLYQCSNGTKSINLACKRNIEKFF
jgi:hypothetical protein